MLGDRFDGGALSGPEGASPRCWATVITLRQLHYFVTVADEGQMTSAATRLYLAQPALSQSISQLEQQLGVQLLVRHSRGVSLTPGGAAFLEKARAAVHAATEAELLARSLVRADTGVLALGFVGSLPMVDAPELFAAFVADSPEVEVLFRELPFPTRDAAAWIDGVDMALCYCPTPHPDVESRPLRSEPRVIVAAHGHPLTHRRELTVAEVLDEAFPGLDPSVDVTWGGYWSLDDHRAARARSLTADRCSTPEELAATVVSGRAITAASASRADKLLATLDGLTTIPLLDADPVQLCLVWRRANRNPSVQAFLDAASLADGAEGG